MLFNSLQFIFFFPVVVTLYFALNQKYRWKVLLIASYYFYMCWNYKFVLLLFTATIICYSGAIWISRSKKKLFRNGILLLTIVLMLGPLFFFKYFNFFSYSLNSVFQKVHVLYQLPSFDLLLPVGISFYTFQALGYTIDVFRENVKPEYHFGRFALFVAFFPQLLAGPIGRAESLILSFHRRLVLITKTSVREWH